MPVLAGTVTRASGAAVNVARRSRYYRRLTVLLFGRPQSRDDERSGRLTLRTTDLVF